MFLEEFENASQLRVGETAVSSRSHVGVEPELGVGSVACDMDMTQFTAVTLIKNGIDRVRFAAPQA
jgi:hypothetical protein